jgi:ABC-2 type transport system ATP-binding protein
MLVQPANVVLELMDAPVQRVDAGVCVIFHARHHSPGKAALPQPPSTDVVRLRVSDHRTVAAISAIELTKRFGDLVAVDDVSFEVAAGSVTGFLGPNGAGKTTTLRMLLGLAAPTSGRALVFGRPFAELEHPATRVGAVLEAGDLHPGRSGRDHLRVLAAAARLPRSRVDEVLALVDLTAAGDRRVEGYSLGMRQRLSLAAALLGRPELLILDEPGNGLDPEGVRWLRDFMRAFAGEGGTVFVSSHHLSEIEQTVDHVVVIDHGRLVADAPLAELAAGSHTLEDAFLELTTEPAP